MVNNSEHDMQQESVRHIEKIHAQLVEHARNCLTNVHASMYSSLIDLALTFSHELHDFFISQRNATYWQRQDEGWSESHEGYSSLISRYLQVAKLVVIARFLIEQGTSAEWDFLYALARRYELDLCLASSIALEVCRANRCSFMNEYDPAYQDIAARWLGFRRVPVKHRVQTRWERLP